MRPQRQPSRGRPEPPIEAGIEQALARALQRMRPVPNAAEAWVAALDELCLRPSKRLRPRLCALAYQGVARSRPPPGVLDFAAGLELLHTFMLVHDDLIDAAALRRGGPSLHRHLAAGLGPTQTARAGALAMLGGDALFAAACEVMAAAEVPDGVARRAMVAVLSTARQAAMGETLDVLYEATSLGALSSASLAEVLRLKTASYTFVGPLVAGAILAGGSEERQRVLASFGERVGVAFQLADDLLDLLACSTDTGKPVGGDLREGKRTVLMRLLLDRSPPRDRKRLDGLLDRHRFPGAGPRAPPGVASASSAAQLSEVCQERDVAWVAGLVRRTGVGAEMVSRVRNLVGAASRELSRAALEPAAARQLRALSRRVVASVRHCAEAEPVGGQNSQRRPALGSAGAGASPGSPPRSLKARPWR